MDGLIGNEDTTRVEAQVTGKSLNQLTVAQHQDGHIIQLGRVELARCQDVDLFFRQTEDLAQLTHYGTVLKGIVRSEDGAILEPLEDVARNIGTVAPGKVEVEVGWILSVEVDKPLEVEVELDGIHIGDAQNIGHHAVGAAPPPHIKVALATGVGGNVPIDQKVGNEFFLGDDLQLLFQSVDHHLIGIGIAVGDVLVAKLAKKLVIFLHGSGVGAEVLVRVGIAEFKIDAAALQEVGGIGDDLRKIAVEGHHLVAVHPAVVGLALLAFGEFGKEAIVVDGAQQTVGVKVPLGIETVGMPHHQFVLLLRQWRAR